MCLHLRPNVTEQHPFAENSPGRAVNYVVPPPPPELNDLSHTKTCQQQAHSHGKDCTTPRGRHYRLALFPVTSNFSPISHQAENSAWSLSVLTEASVWETAEFVFGNCFCFCFQIEKELGSELAFKDSNSVVLSLPNAATL